MENYKLGASYCKNKFGKGGVAIFVHRNIQYSNINIDKYCKEKDNVCSKNCISQTENMYQYSLYISYWGYGFLFIKVGKNTSHIT